MLSGCQGAAPSNSDDLRAVAADVDAWVRHQCADKQVPAICFCLVDVDPVTRRERWWSAGVGLADPVAHTAATATTTLRVGSISKLFTATAAMVLAEQGSFDLDAPVAYWLPGFAPQNPFDGAITLRQLLTHRAGVVCEPPVGHYADASSPDLAATLASAAGTTLIARPGERVAYSNLGYAAVGGAVAHVTGEPFAAAVDRLVCAPLGLADSSFSPRPDLRARQAVGTMWTYDGRAIATPDFALGCAPALDLRSTVVDLAKFARSWLPDAPQRVLSPETQAAMWHLPAGQVEGQGLGFQVSALDGHRRVGHDGTVYGFASELAALPEDGLCVAVVGTVDFANDLAAAIADFALRAMLAHRRGERLSPPPTPAPIAAAAARALVGRYRHGDEWFDLVQRSGELVFDPSTGVASRMRAGPDGLVCDDRLAVSGRSVRIVDRDTLDDGQAQYVRDDRAPATCRAEWLPLLGDYGFDHAIATVYEDSGSLFLLRDWLVRTRLDPGDVSIAFEHAADGAVAALVLAGVRLPRRPDPSARIFRIVPVRPLADLRAAIVGSRPPAQPAGLRSPDLVDLRRLDPGIHFDVRYATADNFLGEPVYPKASPSLQRPAAEALLRAQRALAARGFGICVFDAYRPWSITKLFWDATPAHLHDFVADPAQGSRHNRGCAVDLSLYDLATGQLVEMPSGYDEFTPRAYPDWPGGTGRQRWHRGVLRRAMEDAGFAVYEFEWWHFDFADWRSYPVLDEPLR
jgi:D-alanyl-D-alanine dipeptidase/CubicO group peptidase (beta-lactamase class C family)